MSLLYLKSKNIAKTKRKLNKVILKSGFSKIYVKLYYNAIDKPLK